MARQWSLPEEFAQLIEAHTKLDRIPGRRLQRARQAGGRPVGPAAGQLTTSNGTSREKFLSAFEQLAGGKAPDRRDRSAQIDQEFTEFAPVLKLAGARQVARRSTGTTPLRDHGVGRVSNPSDPRTG